MKFKKNTWNRNSRMFLYTLLSTTVLLPSLYLNAAIAQTLNAQLIDTRTISSKYMDFLTAHSSWTSNEMEIFDVRVYPRKIWVPLGHISYKIDEPIETALLGKVSSMVTVLVDGRPSKRIRVVAKIEVYKPVLCASRGLTKGQIIRPDDIKSVKMPLSKLRKRYLERPERIIGLAAKRTIRPGQVISPDLVTKPVVVRRGSKVMIVAESPGILVRVPGEVEERGSIGDFVRVKNLGSKRVIIAQVRDSKTVTVNF